MKLSSFLLPRKTILCINAAMLLAAAAMLCLTGCGNRQSEPVTLTDFKLDTVVTVTLYDSQDTDLLKECMALCDKYEKIFSRTMEDSELYRLNHRMLPAVKGKENTYELSEDLAALLSVGLSLFEETDGVFDTAIAPLTSLWNFSENAGSTSATDGSETAETSRVPSAGAVREALSLCGSQNVTLKGREITLPSSGTAFDLGGIAKGYIADRIKEYLLSRHVKSAVIDLGGNVLCIGEKPDGSPFRIGIQKPFAERNETAMVLEIRDCSAVSSGIYERYFEEDGVLYHHILDPATGYPCENELTSVTILSEDSVTGDAMSTACFALGYKKGLEFIQSHDGIEAIFLTRDGEAHYSEGAAAFLPTGAA